MFYKKSYFVNGGISSKYALMNYMQCKPQNSNFQNQIDQILLTLMKQV